MSKYGTYAQRVLGVNAVAFSEVVLKIAKTAMTEDRAKEILKGHVPHLFRRMMLFWGRQELQNMFTKWLLTDTTRPDGTPRAGFQGEVREALVYLSNLHSKTFGLEGQVNWQEFPDKW